MAPLQHRTMFANQRKCPLLQPKRGAFLYAHFGPFAVASISGEHCYIRIDPQGVVTPMPRSDHPPVQVEDPLQLPAIEGGDLAPVPVTGERRDDAQALFTLGWGWRGGFMTLSSARGASSPCSSSALR